MPEKSVHLHSSLLYWIMQPDEPLLSFLLDNKLISRDENDSFHFQRFLWIRKIQKPRNLDQNDNILSKWFLFQIWYKACDHQQTCLYVEPQLSKSERWTNDLIQAHPEKRQHLNWLQWALDQAFNEQMPSTVFPPVAPLKTIGLNSKNEFGCKPFLFS